MTAATTPALVLVPGLLCDERLWRHQEEGLADLADRVLVPDVTGEDSVAGMARSILRAAPERFSLAGLSMGGYVSPEIMRQAPDRVEALALLDTSARPDTRSRPKRGSRYSRSPGPDGSTRCGARSSRRCSTRTG
ncbi:MAG TPA: alpha/beta hydrolase [Rubrobacter sp.]|nr:alpha/beta hydrolase [Rubrobacter sp.]